uniref:Suppressor of cytokine signaling 2 n=1 Tax=Takifugu rubripes TaxID=31033 RepID=A0A674PIR2_TAKRU
MTRQSSESIQTTERDRGASDASRAVESDESSIASAMKDLRKAGGSHARHLRHLRGLQHGKFKLDSVVLVKPKLKQFDSVVHLVEHYVQLSRTGSNKVPSGPHPKTPPPNGTVQLLLTTPVYTATPTLAAPQTQDLPLPGRLKDYLTEYSYHV